MTRGEAQAFIASLHAIANELKDGGIDIPPKVQDELVAMEHVMEKELGKEPYIKHV